MLQNEVPTRSKYTKRDSTTDPNYAIVIDDAGTANWYIGVYGFLETTFTITATISGECADLNNCNGHGQCVGTRQCRCDAGWSGTDCSKGVVTISLNSPVQGSVVRGEWSYFQITITHNNLLRIIVNETTDNGDVDLYVKYDAIPTLWSFDYRDTTVQRNVVLNITEPSLGTWYIGMYGYRNTSFMLTVSTASSCPSQCSLHGTCQGSSCNCDTGFSGIACENMNNELTFGRAQHGFVADAAWNYYRVRPNTGHNLQIFVRTVLGGDCDLYAKAGSEPTKTDYSARDVGVQANFTLTIENPGDAVWYLGVFGYSACEYYITVKVDAVCPGNPPCSTHGSCIGGTCLCDQGFSGIDCNKRDNSMLNGASTQSTTLPMLGWEYYTIDVVNTTYLAIEVKELASTGFVWLYGSKGQSPTLRRYDYSSKDTNSKFHRLRITFDSPQTDTWQIGVYGNPFADRGTFPYSLAAWYTPF